MRPAGRRDPESVTRSLREVVDTLERREASEASETIDPARV